jgi:hypothetical protein
MLYRSNFLCDLQNLNDLINEQIRPPASIVEAFQPQYHKTNASQTLRQNIHLQQSITAKDPDIDNTSLISKDLSFRIGSRPGPTPTPTASSEPAFKPANAS